MNCIICFQELTGPKVKMQSGDYAHLACAFKAGSFTAPEPIPDLDPDICDCNHPDCVYLRGG
jgi:hypothetical protein